MDTFFKYNENKLLLFQTVLEMNRLQNSQKVNTKGMVQRLKNRKDKSREVMAHTFSPTTQEAEAGTCVCLVPTKSRRGCWVLWDWNYQEL